MSKNIPFLLEELKAQTHFIPIYPDNQHWLTAVKDLPVGKRIYENLSQKDDQWGLEIESIKALNVKERQKLKQEASEQRKGLLSYYRLLMEAGEELGVSPEEAEKKLKDSSSNLDEVAPFLEKYLEVSELVEKAQEELDKCNVYLMLGRIDKNFNFADVEALHPQLYSEIYKFALAEKSGLSVEEISRSSEETSEGNLPTQSDN